MTQFNIDNIIDDIAEKGIDQGQAKKGPDKLPEGNAFFRIFAYLEYGKQVTEYKGDRKERHRMRIGLEVSGKNYPPIQTESGPMPRTIWLQELTLSQDDRAGSYKLFQQLSKGSKVKHFAQLLGNRAAFMGEIKHSEDGKYVNVLLNTLRPAYAEAVNDDGELVRTPIKVQELRTPEMLFVWDFATPAMWDSIHIAGEYKAKLDAEGNIVRAAESRNIHQAKILKALNFDTLPCAAYAKGSISRAAEEAVGAAVGEVDSPPAADEDEDGIPY
ncbi:hypothetical protein [Xanthomonas translucens]|uniref:hypothetical protein n=1 Tax=Xanthomonas campestris pv. translucens TaxID=343 RepID=UPI00071E7DBD|nr:hypothetical protein [Xanthomonas translucens]